VRGARCFGTTPHVCKHTCLLLQMELIMVVRRREVPFTGPRTYTTYSNPDWGTNPNYVSSEHSGAPLSATEVTDSSGHNWPLGRGAKTDIGGDFTTHKVTHFNNWNREVVRALGYGYGYRGEQWPLSPQVAMDSVLYHTTPSSEATLMKLGATAIARTIPTNPVADAGTFIGELKSGLPKLVGRELFKTKMKDYRKVGSEYLNVEFGWKPLISDLQKFGTAAIESERIIEQLHRDSGKRIRRKYTFPDEVSSLPSTASTTAANSWCNGLAIYPGLREAAGTTRPRYSYRHETKTWFVGEYTYHLDLGNTLRSRLDRHAAEARKLYGVELTPATVWNLAPWSWAVDWEGNIGDVLHNVSRFSQDGLVLRYGYIMQQKTTRMDVTLARSGCIKGTQAPLSMTVIATSKVRRRATPFGFGFDMTALTGRQSAILGALGISRGPRHR